MRRNGFSLVELLVAMAILIVVVASIAQLLASAVRVNADARTLTFATVLADRKLEELRAAAWGDPALAPSPAASLWTTTPGYVDYCDGAGVDVGGGSTEWPPGAVYVRRWSITPLPDDPANALVIEVSVARRASHPVADRVARDEVRTMAVRMRALP